MYFAALYARHPGAVRLAALVGGILIYWVFGFEWGDSECGPDTTR